MPSTPAYRRQWEKDHPDYWRSRRTSRLGAPATAEQQKACLTDPRKSLESKFGIVTAKFAFCMFCWCRYEELGHHLDRCKKRPAAWHGQKNLPDLYRDLVGLNHGTALACEAVRTTRGEIADKHGLSEYAKKDPNRKELLDRNRPSNIGRKHSRQARLNKSDRQRGIANRARQKTSDATVLRHWLMDGLDIESAARKSGLSTGAMRGRLQDVLGVRVKNTCEFSAGEIVTGRWVRNLLGRLQVKNPDEFKAFISFDVRYWLQPKQQTAVLRSTMAKQLIEAERKLVAGFLGYREQSISSLLRTILPNLSQQASETADALQILGQDGLAAKLDALAESSREEVAHASPSQSHRCLCWLAEISRLVDRPRSALDLLALKYGTNARSIQRGLSEPSQSISHETARAIILPLLRQPRRRRGRPSRRDAETRKRIKKAAAFLLSGYTQTTMAKYLFSGRDDSPLQNTLQLFNRFRKEIELARLSLTMRQARAIVAAAVRTTTRREPA